MEKNPVADVRRPKPEPHRERVATDEDIQKLMVVAQWDGKSPIVTETQLVLCLFLLACRTGIRSGEMLQIKCLWIKDCVIQLLREATKTEQRRDVALCSEARAYLDLILALDYEPRIVGALTDAQRDDLWRKLRDRARLYAGQDCDGIVLNEGLNFHD